MDLYDLLNENEICSSVITYCFGQTKKTFLIGPEIINNNCLPSLKARLESSVVVNKKAYLSVSKNIFRIISEMKDKLDIKDKMIEFDIYTKKVVYIHHLNDIPK